MTPLVGIVSCATAGLERSGCECFRFLVEGSLCLDSTVEGCRRFLGGVRVVMFILRRVRLIRGGSATLSLSDSSSSELGSLLDVDSAYEMTGLPRVVRDCVRKARREIGAMFVYI